MTESSQERAEAALRARLSVIESVEGRKPSGSERAQAIGQNVMREEIGTYGRYEGASYILDDKERDILLAHARQDAATAAVAATRALDELDSLRKQMRGIRRVLFFQLGLFLMALGLVVVLGLG